MYWVITKKIRAGALQYVLVVSVVIAIIVLTFISLLYLQKKLQIKNSFYKEAIQNTNLAIDFLSKKDIPYDLLKQTSVTVSSIGEVTFLKRYWGIFDLVVVRSKVKNEVFQKIALMGGNKPNRKALYLEETNKPLVLVGDTRIIGDVLVSKEGVRVGNISGVSYNGSKLIFGKEKVNNDLLPVIDNLSYLKDRFNQNYFNDSIKYFTLSNNSIITNKFDLSTKVYESKESIILENISLKGNLIIFSKESIKVDSSAFLEDVILVAPNIKVSDNVVGSFQCFASEQIFIGKGCKLKYPSSLVLINELKENLITKSNKDDKIFLDKNVDFRGIIVFNKKRDEEISNFNSQVFISKNTSIFGEVYCNQNLELLGNVFGSVYTRNFITKQSGGIYVNHIYNGVINVKKLPIQYCGLSINKSNLKVAKWLY